MHPESSEATGMRLVNVLYGRPFYPFSPRIFGMFSKIAVFFGSNLFCDSKTNCVFLRSTGFSLLYANFDNLLENRCGQSWSLRTADQCLDLALFTLIVLSSTCYCSWCPFVHRGYFQLYVLPFMHSLVCC